MTDSRITEANRLIEVPLEIRAHPVERSIGPEVGLLRQLLRQQLVLAVLLIRFISVRAVQALRQQPRVCIRLSGRREEQQKQEHAVSDAVRTDAAQKSPRQKQDMRSPAERERSSGTIPLPRRPAAGSSHTGKSPPQAGKIRGTPHTAPPGIGETP